MKGPPSAFTLVEVLVSLTILTILLVLFAQVLRQTSSAIQVADKHLDIASMSRVALDRIGADLSSMTTDSVAPLVVIKNAGGTNAGGHSDALVFVAQGRTQLRTGISASNIRLGIKAYRVEAFADPSLAGQAVPMLAWGDGTVTWTAPGTGTTQASSNIGQALATALSDVTGSSSAAGQMVQFQPLAAGIFRLEVCFLLSDGTLTVVPPTSLTFSSLVSPGVYPLALSADDSADPNQLYVKQLIVGVVGLDSASRRLTGVNGSLLPQLADQFPDPAAGQTPLQVWDVATNPSLRASLAPPAYAVPVIGAIWAYQRYYNVN